MSSNSYASGSLLGSHTLYKDQYDPTLLHPIARADYRRTLPHAEDIALQLAQGYDVWHAYELSCLNALGLPLAFILRLTIPADSSHIVESKSLKLYLTSFNQTRISSTEQLVETINKDLSTLLATTITAELLAVDQIPLTVGDRANAQAISSVFSERQVIQLDSLPVECDCYEPDKSLLQTITTEPKALMISHLLRSNCPVTNQPDWGSLFVAYDNSDVESPFGLQPESLLKYVVSYRLHNGFHEQTVEAIFADLLELDFARLFVAAQYTRRGGIDISPVRTKGNSLINLPRVNRM